MRPKKMPVRPAPKKAVTPAIPDFRTPWRVALWLIVCVNSLFFLPPCLDRYLVPRFLFLSLALLVSVWMLRRELRAHSDWRLHGFDLLMLAWYGMNLASIFWALSWSEAVFYTQKVSLLLLTYWLIRQALQRDAGMVRQTLRQITSLLTYAYVFIIVAELVQAYIEHGLDNEKLYDAVSGVSGNKSLASDFLFFLLVLNVLFYRDFQKKFSFWLNAGLLTTLIILLQTRTVYLALLAGAGSFFVVKAILEPVFARFFLRRMLPAGVLALGLLAALIVLKGKGNSLAERLNPATYLESTSANERRFVWYKTDELNKDHVWFGVGNGSWKFWFPSKNIQGGYRLQEQNVVFTRVHNDYLEIRAEMGLVGAGLFCLLFIAAFLSALWAVRRTTDDTSRHEILVVSAGLLGYCIIQYFDFPRERIEIQVMLALFFAWLSYHARGLWERLPGLRADRWIKPLGLLVTAGLLFNLVIGWKRIAGEIHNVRMLQAQAKGYYRAMALEAAAARNTFYEYDDVALPLLYHEGTALYQNNQIGPSLKAFEQAYRLNPWSFAILNNYASALTENGDYRAAIPLFEKTVDINPGFDEGKLNLTYSWFKLGEYAKALEWLERVDTVANPQNEMDRKKNQITKKRQADFMKLIDEKMRK